MAVERRQKRAMSYEVRIDSPTKKAAKKLANLLLEAGYSVYYVDASSHKSVAATIPDEDVTKINYKKAEEA